jgi:hypothetical protein
VGDDGDIADERIGDGGGSHERARVGAPKARPAGGRLLNHQIALTICCNKPEL